MLKTLSLSSLFNMTFRKQLAIHSKPAPHHHRANICTRSVHMKSCLNNLAGSLNGIKRAGAEQKLHRHLVVKGKMWLAIQCSHLPVAALKL